MNITGSYRQKRSGNQPMSLIVSSIVVAVNEQNNIVANVPADDWTAATNASSSDERITTDLEKQTFLRNLPGYRNILYYI